MCGGGAHPVFEVGEVDVPAQRDDVHVNDAEFWREEVEVDHLSWRPDTPVSLQAEDRPISHWGVCVFV